ncbi:hypothetical protein D3C81_310290 [compost metagenome]|uniref:NAD synthetase n=1 Tax=Pseudomonas wadenswilerensis TaxID=1785161 RepID=A0A380SSU1_9PSED|nr:NAD synthetase [Pseudomonas wadenswilerensis]SUQ61049.1 NAD synthetase [Pseudomonas wadenswilerensis]
MTDSRMSGLGASPSRYFARQRVESQTNLPKLFAAIDADPGIVGAGVVYIDADYNIIILREFQPLCSVLPKRVILRETKKYLTPAQFLDQLRNNPRESRVIAEALSASVACVSAWLGWSVVFSGTVAVPFTAGVSAVLVPIGAAAAAASSAQCLIGVQRVFNEVLDPAENDRLDSLEWYRNMSSMLEAVSLLGAGVSGATTIKYLQLRKATTGRSWNDLSQRLSRQQRKALTDELLKLKHPSLTAKQLRLKQSLGELPKRYTPTEFRHGTINLIKDSLGATLSVAGSSYSKSIAIGLYEEFSE